MRFAATALLLLTAACATGDAGLPGRIVNLPWSDAPADRSVLQARALAERGDNDGALELVAAVLGGEPRHVDAHRLRQDILRGRGRRGLLLHEAETRLLANPEDALGWYLRGRVAFSTDEKLRSFRRAIELAPDSLWGWLGLGHTLRGRRPQRALEVYDRLYAETDAHPLVAIAFAQVLQRTDMRQRLAAVCDTLREDRRVPGIGDLYAAQALLTQDDRAAAWGALLAAVRSRPFDGAVQRLANAWLQAGLDADQIGELFDVMREDPARLQAFGQGDGIAVLAELLRRHAQPQAALDLLVARGQGARQPALRRLERRLRLASGDVDGCLAMLRADLPRPLLTAEPNQLRARWLTLLDGPWYDGEPLRTAAQAAALLRALLDTGLLVEAEQLAATALARYPADVRVTVLRDEARAQLAFEAGLRRLLYRGYRDGDSADLAAVTGRLRALSARVFGRDVIGDPPRFQVPLVGEMLDPFHGGLAAHLARYNRHLVLGRRSGGVAEGMLLTRLSLSELPADARLPLRGPCLEVIAIDRDVRALTGVIGGDLAGIALLNHFLIDFDAVREWARSVAERRAVIAADGGALLRDPLPRQPADDPAGVAWRLAALSPVQDADLELAVLDTIRHHERQHLVDSFHYLPIENNLLRGLSLAMQFGLSAAAIQGEMERRAELASLAISPHTELVLAHIVDFLGEPGAESPHHRGFGALARQIELTLRGMGVDAAAAAPARWHELDMALVRRVAQTLLDRLP